MEKIVMFIFSFAINSLLFAQELTDTKIIEGKKYIQYRVQKGQSAMELTRIYKIDLSQLKAANKKVNLDKIKKNQIILIPVITQEATTKNLVDSIIKVDETHANADEIQSRALHTHIVQQGETLSKIAQKYRVSVDDLIKWNALRATNIIQGQELIISQFATIKPFEAWNGLGAVRFKNQKANAPLLATDMLVEEIGYTISSEEEFRVAHAGLPVGSLVQVTNLENGKQILLTTTHILQKQSDNFILELGIGYNQQLNIEKGLTRVKIRYIQP